jgi:sulfite reductase (ferredoxin)
MQRTKVLGGALDARGWRTLGAIARRLTQAAPLHLTTRQDVEIHDLSAKYVPEVQRTLGDAGLTTVGACGDTLRNIVVCPCSGTLSGRPDLEPLARRIGRVLEETEGVFSLPRKFKISLSACREGCGQPWIQDLGLVAEKGEGRWGFRVIGGGSLGPRPAAGILLHEWLPAEDVLPLVVSAVRFFAAHGDRANRRRARLRHVRERIGDEAFRQELADGLAAARSERSWPAVNLVEAGGGWGARLVLTFANGDVSPEAADALADLAETDGLKVRIAGHHRVIVFGRDSKSLRARVEKAGALRAAAQPQPSVVACPGKRWCSRALADTNGLADRIRERFTGALGPAQAVCISGCPNGCAHSHVADIGLVGVVRSEGGRPVDGYDLLVGGGMGRSARLARLEARKLCADEVILAIFTRLARPEA